MRLRIARAAALCLSLSLAAVGALGGGCSKGPGTLGLPDSYLMFTPARDEAGKPSLSPSGLPVLDRLALDDERAVPYHRLFAVGFAAEMLRSDYLLKQFIRDASWQGKKFPPAAQAFASEPTVFVVQGGPRALGAGFAVKGFFGGPQDQAGVHWLGLTDDPARDSALSQSVTAQLGRRIATTIATSMASMADGAGAPPAQVLIDGYTSAMEVIAREWRVGEGPAGALAPDSGTEAQREIFASVRQNSFAMALRPAAEMMKDPGLAATVIYRMAQSKGVGARIAPAELYAPFVSERVPAGVSPASVLGPFRNFQAKLIAVWGRAVLRGAPPHDIAELVEAYAHELPAERNEVIRLFVVTTFGATVKPGGVTFKGDASLALPELTALSAEVAAGRRTLRDALALNTGK